MATTQTIKSDSVVSYPAGGDIYKDAFIEILNTDEFKSLITYYSYNLDTDNLSGDIDRTSYSEYSLYAIIDLAKSYDKSVKLGMLEIGDCELFLPSVVTVDSSGTAISFQPKEHDEFIWNGIRFALKERSPEYIADSSIHTAWICKRIDNSN